MALVVQYLSDFSEYFNQFEDPRTGQWFLVSSIYHPIILCLAYAFVIKFLAPRFMKHRKPFELKTVLIIYNLFQVVFNTWIFYEFGVNGWFRKDWSFRCAPMDYTDNSRAYRMARACWFYYISKYIDFLDTIFFVLRKKYNQITILHVSHHGMIPLVVWVGVKFAPGGHGSLSAFLNSFVHIVMYGYYLLAAMGPKVQKYLWWKKYITMIQIIQFVVILVHGMQVFVTDCDYPKVPLSVMLSIVTFFLILFSKFYKKAYVKEASTDKSKFNFKKNIVISERKNA